MRIIDLSKRQEATKPLKMYMGIKPRDDVGVIRTPKRH